MEDLIKKIAEEAEISEDKAEKAAGAAVEFIKERVARSLDVEVEKILKDTNLLIKAQIHEALTGEPLPTIGERVSEFTSEAREKLGEIGEEAREKLDDFVKSAQGFFGSFGKKNKEEEASKKKEESSDDDD